MARIDLVDLAHSYGGNDAALESYALKPVTMTWRQGGAYALLGPSGCGKNTLLNLISGIVTPSRGKILFDGADITPLSTQKRNIAQVFSDPPLNIVGIEKKNGSVQYAGGIQAPASGLYASLADGPYRVGFRAHQLEVANGIAGRHAFSATVTVTEITGSESFVHLNRDDSNWVAVLQGIHEYPPGHVLDAALDPNNVFVFDPAGRLVAAPGAM